MIPAALLLERDEPLDRRARHDCERDALLDVRRLAVPGGEQRRAHGAGPLALRPEHVAVDDELLLVAEQPGEIGRAVLAIEAVFLGTFPPGGSARRCSATRSIWRRARSPPPAGRRGRGDIRRSRWESGRCLLSPVRLRISASSRHSWEVPFLSEAAFMRGSSRTPR